MSRLALWWACLAGSLVVVAAALMSRSGTCVDSADGAASSCSSGGSGGLLLIGLAALVLSVVRVWRAYRTDSRNDPRR